MSILDTLITDRTQADATQLRPKGLYNATDLNRVGQAQAYLSERFARLGYRVVTAPKTDWQIWDIPRAAQMDTYIRDLRALRGVYGVLKTTPAAPATMQYLTFQTANDIEQILVDIEKVLTLIRESYRRSGAYTFWSGYHPLPSADYDPGRNWSELDALDTTWAQWDGCPEFYTLIYGKFGRDWSELDALGLSWEAWNQSTFYQLQYGIF